MKLTEEQRRANVAARRADREALKTQRRADKRLILEALRVVLTAPDATATQRLYAATALDEIMGYRMISYRANRIMQNTEESDSGWGIV